MGASKKAEDIIGTSHTTCSTAGPARVYTDAEGKMIRVEPLEFDPAEVDSWEVEVNGKVYRPPLTHPLLPWGLVAKQMNYSEDRVGYPLKRVDWDPHGERNPQNRGISGYERISWDEAFDTIEEEMRRTVETYGNSALGNFWSAHPEWGSLHYFFSDWDRFWDMIGSTSIQNTPNSWEGWACGAAFLWGFWKAMGVPPAEDSLQDVSEDSEFIVVWGTEPLAHNLYGGIDQARIWKYWKELGKKVVLIEPLFNECGLYAADKWLPIYPGTDGALACAIAYQWIVDGTYDQDYLDTHCIGFDEDHMPEGVPVGLSFKTYIMGEAEDKTPKTPEWAAEICGISAPVIRVLAREWGSKPTSLWVLTGGAGRRQFSHEFTRLAAILQLMQGLGKPGVNILGTFLSLCGPYDMEGQVGPIGYADGGMNNVLENYTLNSVKQMLTFSQWYGSLYGETPRKWHGGRTFNDGMNEFFEDFEYPAEGCSPVRFYWQRGSSFTCNPNLNEWIKTLRHPTLETVVVTAPWFDRDCRYADIVLPATTLYERQDFTEPAKCGQFIPPAYIGLRSAVYHQKCVEPLGESMSDMHILEEMARRFGLQETYLEGNTEESLLRKMFDNTNIPMTFEEIQEKGYYVWPAPKDYKKNKQFSDFYRDPEAFPLETPTGKMEIFSTSIWGYYEGYNAEIPPVPHYIPEREGHQSTELRKKYPLQLLMAHPKFRFHGKFNNCEWLAENYKVYGPDGYKYEPVWMTPADAAERGIEDGEIVRCFNDRGAVLAGVRITDRLMPGVAWLTYGAWNDPMDDSGEPLDRAGNGNVLTNSDPMSVHHISGAYNSTLLEIEKIDLDAILAKYPEGAAGKYRTWNREG